eukprot:CAMPEP_0201520106 /NCGR_PEP_ID=MMETSP0161_2-20130828/10494_1 /ASSEMBLY_ACC=CAM_ASM_000251 /TAXON_ID=180227 /ORGANISM="Neoparamoeba aestuarina, Strain SoJaBio B1-5/56/2" /LENGTH=232 /DNA_ID=CAMNT_0047918373 /DNA_START=77 /DNA_END=775 /DNA_ORIENTATION=+
MSRRYCVAIDDSENAGWAFNYATSSMDKHNDELHLVTIREGVEGSLALAPGFGASGAMYDHVLKQREAEKKRCTRLLRTYARLAHQLGFTTKLHLTIGAGDISETLCEYVEEHNIDFLVMGRRGMGAVKRFFLGSNSKSCVEAAVCNVIIIKHPFGPEIVHDTTKEDVHAAEEEERQWRIKEYERKIKEEKEKADEESKKDLELCHKMEEEERHRREHEDVAGRSVSGRAQD